MKFHILCDKTLTEKNSDKLKLLVEKYNQQIKFYNVEELAAEKISKLQKIFASAENSRFSVGSLFRLLLGDLIAEEKIIYLDADIIVNLNIVELWQIDLQEKILAAVTDKAQDMFHAQRTSNKYLLREKIINAEDYFNAGVLLIDLKKFRAENLERGVSFAIEHNCEWFDQDILNYCFSKNFLKLPEKFNSIPETERIKNQNSAGQKIYHYTADNLQFDANDALNNLWLKYFAKTPWFDEKIFANIFEGVLQIYNEQKNFSLQLTKILKGKQRGFFISSEFFEPVKNIFAIESGEEIIFAKDNKSIQNLVASIKKSKGKKIFFVVVKNYFEVALQLLNAGLIFGKDFLNGAEFLMTTQGIPMNTYSMIKLL